MNDSVDHLRVRKLAQIDQLYREMSEQSVGAARCPHCFGSPPPPINIDHAKLPKAEQLARAVYFVKWPDEHTFAEHERRRRLAMLAACPTYDPPLSATLHLGEAIDLSTYN